MKAKILLGLSALCLLVGVACKKKETPVDKKAQTLTIRTLATLATLAMKTTVAAEATSDAGTSGGTIGYSIASTIGAGAGSATISTDKQTGSMINPVKEGTVILTASTVGNAQFESSSASITIVIGAKVLP